MRIRQFEAQGVQGHLKFDLHFREDFTFLIGLNGTGKTSALQLMMALLTPNLSDLGSLKFDSAKLLLDLEDLACEISAVKSSESLRLSVSAIEDVLVLGAAELQLLEQPLPPDEERSPVLARALEHPVCTFIMTLGTPMFLGVDRRHLVDATNRDPAEHRRRSFLVSRSMREQQSIRKGNVAAGLADVNVLVHDSMNEIRGEQERLDARLRDRILASAFEYKPSSIDDVGAPSTASLNQYREKRADIENAVRNLQIPFKEVTQALSAFLERMNTIAADFLKEAERQARPGLLSSSRKRRDPDRYGAHSGQGHEPVTQSQSIVEWIVNKAQVDRIMSQIELLTKYNEERSALRGPIDKFLMLLNSFLGDTGKRVFVTDRGALNVEMADKSPQSIGSLSSGERQLVVMLGHLALNKQLSRSGIFIVDEPELSLHISWQERFLDAIREANPFVQIILATHSPAIILDRDDNCESLDSNVARRDSSDLFGVRA